MSLKRPYADVFADDRSIADGDESACAIQDTPALQESSWGNYVAELLNPVTPHGADGEYADYCPVDESLFFTQRQIDQWAAENFPSLTTSISSSPDQEGEQICYGMLFRVPVKLCGDMAVLDSRLSSADDYPFRGHYQMQIVRHEDQTIIGFPDSTSFGEANAQLEKALKTIADQRYQIDLEVLAHVKSIREVIHKSTKEKDAVVRVNINLYGARCTAQGVGRELSRNKLYLQRPDYMRPGSHYDNPHELKLPDYQSSFQDYVMHLPEEKKSESEINKAEAFKTTLSTVYSSLTRGQKLIGLEGDDSLKTPLLLHQMQALDFMTQRESGPIPEEFRLWKLIEIDGKTYYRHIVTNNTSPIFHPETGGGILADEMGMGKTLSILALILRTRDSAYEWAHEATLAHEIRPEHKRRRRTRATLIVASSDLMINEWFQEMERHFRNQVRGALRTIKYHGTNRETNPTKLCDADLIITTYHTLASDYAKDRSPLNGIEWYRLVLDEAHIIRRQSTVLNRTVTELNARSRWCLTGTPIQNRLEDIGALFAFIKANPFHTLSTFKKHISLPFDEGGKRRAVATENFTLLLDSLCLRRTKDLLHLPDQRDCVRVIEFSAEEKRQYEQTKKTMFRAAKNQVGGFDQRSTLGMFQVWLQLRILCNHGTYQQPFSWNRRKLHLLDEREAIETSLGRNGEVTCSACKQTMPIIGSGLYRRFTEHCRHVLCSECIEQSTPDGQDTLPKSCPLCAPLWANPPHHQRPTLFSEDEGYFRSQGRSSKMEALMVDVKADLGVSKSIIFSCWTHTLDLIQLYLKAAGITFQRIDGECATSKRQHILDNFAHNPQLRVLIMTTGTGAVGLNLATANRVFLVEPQWNPSVENQAIARALRLGQEQPVQVTRYVVNRSVEQEMRSLQDRKLEIAGIAWE